MDDLVTGDTAGGAGRWYRRLVPPLAMVLLATLPGCGGDGGGRDGDPPAGGDDPRPRAELAQLRAGNGLFYPPELWDALAPSARSEVLRNAALRALGEPVEWSTPDEQLYQALADETDPLTAASLLVEAGVDPPVGAIEVTAWLAEPGPGELSPPALERLWRAVTVAAQIGLDVELPAAVVEQVSEQASDPSPLIRWQAAEVLAELGAPAIEQPAAQGWLDQLVAADPRRSPQTLARELYAWVRLHGADPTAVDRGFWDPLLELAATSDEVYSYAVRAFAHAGAGRLASDLAQRFDQRRLLPGGQVLEPPAFDGSVGSTFRVVRYVAGGPGGAPAALGEPLAAELTAAITPLLDRDTSHLVAGLAANFLLGGPEAVTAGQRRAAVAQAMADAGVDAGTPMSLEQTLGWISTAEYAIAMETAVEFPGLSPTALDLLRDPGELDPERDDALYAVARLLLALAGTGHAGAAEVPVLADHLMTALAGREPTEANSLLLFAGSLALLETVGETPVPEPELLAEADHRRGDCLGGFTTFVREWSAPGAVCNIEATRYADMIREVIG